MMDKEKILECIKQVKDEGHDVKMRDACYCLLLHEMSDYSIAYKSLFGTNDSDSDIEAYHNSDKIKLLKRAINKASASMHASEAKEYEDISFDENKEAMVRLLKKLDSDVASGIVDVEKAYAIETNIRKELVSRFATTKKIDEQVIQVEAKYNDICPYCNHEVRAKVLTKEEAINMYNLKE